MNRLQRTPCDKKSRPRASVQTVLAWPIVIFCAFVAYSTANADFKYVDAREGHALATGSLTSAFGDLQNAIDQAVDGDTIYIHPGRYEALRETFIEPLCGNCEDHQTPVNASRGFYIHDKSLTLVGLDRDSTILITNAGYGVYFENSRGSTIRGVTITGGLRDEDGMATDAGVVAKYATVTVTDCAIRDNIHRQDSLVIGIGGVIIRENSEVYVVGNLIENNGWDGVALYRGASAVIADNVIRQGRGAGVGITWDAVATVYRNRVSEFWKGIGTFGASCAVVRNNAIFHNLGWGMVATHESYMDCANNVVYSNGNCGFILGTPDVTGRVTNCVFARNGWRDEWICPCVGIANYGNPFVVRFSHNIFWENEAGAFEGMPDMIDIDGNVAVDPAFSDTLSFRPGNESPMIDTGNPELTDPDGTRSDIGLFGGPQARPPVNDGIK